MARGCVCRKGRDPTVRSSRKSFLAKKRVLWDETRPKVYGTCSLEKKKVSGPVARTLRKSFMARCGELRTQKFKSHLVRAQSLNVLPLKPRVGQYIAIHATLTARNFFLAYFYPSSSFTRIFSKPLPIFFCVGCG